jgi:hypothetical protein
MDPFAQSQYNLYDLAPQDLGYLQYPASFLDFASGLDPNFSN